LQFKHLIKLFFIKNFSARSFWSISPGSSEGLSDGSSDGSSDGKSDGAKDGIGSYRGDSGANTWCDGSENLTCGCVVKICLWLGG
jgi:hypothetical protein